ncbi:His-Xaa-Ser system protein HxsD [Empedobacter falsenii]
MKNIEFKLDSNLYSKDAIFKCVYWYSNEFNINLSIIENSIYFLELEAKQEISEEKIITIKNQLNQDLIDFNLRDIITKETQNLRDLLVAKAFSNGEYDEEPPGEYSDPVGFKLN